jgi:hypothetical protein
MERRLLGRNQVCITSFVNGVPVSIMQKLIVLRFVLDEAQCV